MLLWVIDTVGIDFSNQYINNSIILGYIKQIAPKIFELIGFFIPHFKEIFDMLDLFKNN